MAVLLGWLSKRFHNRSSHIYIWEFNMKSIFEEAQDDARNMVERWKINLKRHRHLLSIQELEKKIQHARWLEYSLAFLELMITSKLIELYLIGKTSVPLLFCAIMFGIAIYDEQQNINNLRLFIYFRIRDKMEDEPVGRSSEDIYKTY